MELYHYLTSGFNQNPQIIVLNKSLRHAEFLRKLGGLRVRNMLDSIVDVIASIEKFCYFNPDLLSFMCLDALNSIKKAVCLLVSQMLMELYFSIIVYTC
jgi:hypothetical protein